MSERKGTDEVAKPVGTTDESTEITRRDFMKGAAAAGVIVGADEYVKPTLKLLGVSRLAAAASTPPPPPPPPPQEAPKKGCTPGFWGNNSSSGQGGGVEWWNTNSDADWIGNGGAPGTQPFSHGTLFTTVFTSHPLLVGATMWTVVNGGGGEQPARKAARQLVAAYLNASFGTYAYTRNQLRTMWTNAVQGGNPALNQLNTLLDTTNNACDQQ